MKLPLRWVHTMVLVLSAVLVSLPSGAVAQEKIIRSVAIEGNHRIEKDAILNILSSRAGQPLSAAKIQEDVRAIYRMGYFLDAQASFSQASGRLTFKVREKALIREIDFEGNDDEDDDDLKEKIKAKKYSYLDPNLIREDEKKLREHYDSKGYYLAEISSEIKQLESNEVKVIYKIRENRKVKIRQISFIGNKKFSDEDLKGSIRTKEKGFMSFLSGSGQYQEDMLAQDRQLLRDFYGHHGYIRANIGSPRVQLSPDKRFMTVTFTVEEGEIYQVGTITLDGEFIKEKSELEEKITLKEGETVDTLKIQSDIQALSTIYMDEGYAYANIIPRDSYDDERKIVNLVYFFQPGQKVYFERIEIEGNESTRDKVIRRELEFREGEVYNYTKIRNSQQNIQRMALYEDVKISTPRGSADDRVNVLINITEKSTGTFSVGAAFNTLESFQVFGQIQKRNLFGYGVDLSLEARLGGRTQSFNLQYRDEWFLDTRLGLTLNAFNISRRYTDYDLRSRGISAGFDYPLYTKGLERIRAGATYNIVDQNLSDIRSTVENLFEGGLTSSVTFAVSRDTRNRVFEPTKGSYYKVSEEIAGGPFGGDNAFAKTEIDGRWFFPVLDSRPTPLIGDSVFALHLGAGYVTPIQDGDRVPLFERYYPGGIFSIRGFPIRSLGPEIDVASTSDPSGFTTTDFNVGGNKQLVFNAEYIFPIVRAAQIKGVLFFDMGNAFDNGESMFTLAGQRQSAGFGINWFSPIGPLRFAWGFPLDRKQEESLLVFDFTIGSLF